MRVRSYVLGSVCVCVCGGGGGGGRSVCARACMYVEVCVCGVYHLRILRVSAPAVTKQSCQP